MTATYFSELTTLSPTRVWVNNPTLEELDRAISQGAVGCTTNPAFAGGLLRRAPEEIRPLVAEAARATEDDDKAVEFVQGRLVARIAERLLPLFEATNGHSGHVSIQGAPEADAEGERILAEARAGHAIGPNATPKIPATAPGLEAFEEIVADGYPVIATEIFSLAQLVETCERYMRVTAQTKTRPPFFASPITGIFGDFLKAKASRDGVVIRMEDMALVGVALARACQRLVLQRGYPVILLAGGARSSLDLTGLVGANLHCTINWSMFAELLADPAPFAQGYDAPLDAAVIERLGRTFPEVECALRPDGLTLTDFEHFGPVRHFRDGFVAGWTAVREAIAGERLARAAANQ